MGEERKTSITVIAFNVIVRRASDIIVIGVRKETCIMRNFAIMSFTHYLV
jgi:ribosomal silencing factor RsfS